MKYLMTQEEFEVLIGRAEPTDELPYNPAPTVVYFTATWCGPCRSVRPDELEEGLKGVQWLKCDVDQNQYTPGYCQVRSIPTFLVIKDKKILGKFSATGTDAILNNVQALLDGTSAA